MHFQMLPMHVITADEILARLLPERRSGRFILSPLRLPKEGFCLQISGSIQTSPSLQSGDVCRYKLSAGTCVPSKVHDLPGSMIWPLGHAKTGCRRQRDYDGWQRREGGTAHSGRKYFPHQSKNSLIYDDANQ